MEKQDRLRGMLLGAFAADAFALGPHWIYDPNEIQKHYGRPMELTAPLPDSWHPNKEKGDYTHYGDQMFHLLSFLNEKSGYTPEEYSRAWQSFMENYSGYCDKAMQLTLGNLKEGRSWAEAASDSSDFSAIGRITPLLFWFHDRPDEAVSMAIEMVSMTHKHSFVLSAGRFFAKLALMVLEGEQPSIALKSLWGKLNERDPVKGLIKRGMDQVGKSSFDVILDFGAQCPLENALPSTVQMILKYEEDYQTALTENVVAGGDSAARGMVLGMILGAWQGTTGIPENWLDGMKKYRRIKEIISNRIVFESSRR